MNIMAFFLIPRSIAQELVYKGADTEHIPEFNIYPSERYYYNYSGPPLFDDETYLRFDIVKGNTTDTFMGMSSIPHKPPLVNGTCVFGDVYMGNTTSGEEVLQVSDYQFVYWNESIGLVTLNQYPAIFLPLNQYTGEIQSLNIAIVSVQWALQVAGFGQFEHTTSYPSIYSVELWNSTYNNAYYKMNFTEKGLQINTEIYNIVNAPNITLISKPAQLPPVFSFTTEGNVSTVTTRFFNLELDIPPADNNNDVIPDTDYQYRYWHHNDGWTDWKNVTTPLIEYDVGGNIPQKPDNHTISVEIKNMYGSTHEEITVEYLPSTEEAISGYSEGLIIAIFIFSLSILLIKYRKKYEDK